MDARSSPGARGKLAVGVAALAMLLAGCSSGEPEDGEAGSGNDQESTVLREAGLFFGECGGVSTDELMALTGIRGVRLQERNSVGCRWESSLFGPHASFSWYRGSPIGRERAVVELSGRGVRDVSVAGPSGELTGFAGWGRFICEVSIQSNSDFFVWSVVFAEELSDDEMCRRVLALAEATVNRAEP
ncbi:DUF3558 domain-containing protein [Lolliginicoccus suaedae]|uniref:DUF3558 domain-containing protein n=1 Tax=Lolliginicoccus suaedae TaxID=2605429 RepID=UPI0011EDF8D1|nr:DUF3558 domain-containing protein [Lolliginicoccus suaedae]